MNKKRFSCSIFDDTNLKTEESPVSTSWRNTCQESKRKKPDYNGFWGALISAVRMQRPYFTEFRVGVLRISVA
jgi:hypothetical protein